MEQLIINAVVVTVDPQRRVLWDGALLIRDDRIADIGSTEELKAKYPAPHRTLDAAGKVIFPGFVNNHTHLFQTLLKGIGDDMELGDWLSHMMFPAAVYLEPEDTYHAAMLGLSEQSGDIMRTVDKIEKIGPDLVRAILVDDYAIEGEKADEILAFIGIKGTNEEVLASLEKYRGRNEMFDQGLDELTTVAKYLGAFGVPQENFAVDLTIARGLDYYTGTVYETTLLDHPEIGSVCSGGRYDNLAEYYTDRKLPGVGISIGVTRLFYVLGEQGLLNSDICTAPADVLILPMTEDLSEAISLATDLRAAGVSTQIYTEKKKFKAKMNYADKLKVPYVYFLGEDEINAGVVSCKDMRTGEQVKLPRAEAVEKAKAFVESDRQKPVICEK